MKAIELQHRFNSAYAKALVRKPNRAVYYELVNMLFKLNTLRSHEGLEPLNMPNLITAYETLCGPVPCTDRDGVRTRSEYTTIK